MTLRQGKIRELNSDFCRHFTRDSISPRCFYVSKHCIFWRYSFVNFDIVHFTSLCLRVLFLLRSAIKTVQSACSSTDSFQANPYFLRCRHASLNNWFVYSNLLNCRWRLLNKHCNVAALTWSSGNDTSRYFQNLISILKPWVAELLVADQSENNGLHVEVLNSITRSPAEVQTQNYLFIVGRHCYSVWIGVWLSSTEYARCPNAIRVVYSWHAGHNVISVLSKDQLRRASPMAIRRYKTQLLALVGGKYLDRS